MVSLRPMQDTLADYTALQSWFHDPGLQEWVWCDEPGEPPVSLERVMEKYGPRVKSPTDVFPWFILRNGAPIGFIQYYFSDEATVGLDMWIGSDAERGHGYGTEALRQMTELIPQLHPQVRTLFIDPDPANTQAIRCYLKVGFRDTGKTIWDDGSECLLLARGAFSPSGLPDQRAVRPSGLPFSDCYLAIHCRGDL